MEVLEELLKEFEGQEPEDPIVMYLAAPLQRSILHFWPQCEVEWNAPERPRPERPSQRWEWLWEGVQYDLQKLASFVGAPPYVVRSRVRLFAGWRWILPNGKVDPKIEAALMKWSAALTTEKKPDEQQPSIPKANQKPN